MQQQQQQVYVFFLLYFGGDLWDFGYCILCFVIISQKKWKNLRLYQGHETGKKQTKDAANIRVVMNFLSFVCLSQSDSKQPTKNPIRFNKTGKKHQKIAAGFFQLIQFLCKSISIYTQKSAFLLQVKEYKYNVH